MAEIIIKGEWGRDDGPNTIEVELKNGFVFVCFLKRPDTKTLRDLEANLPANWRLLSYTLEELLNETDGKTFHTSLRVVQDLFEAVEHAKQLPEVFPPFST